MREIVFRGKRIDNGEWAIGDLLNFRERKVIHCYENKCRVAHDVDGNSIGQYTGLTDKNGKKIFEGDIVKKSWIYHYYVNHQRRSKINTFIGQIVFDSGSYIMKEQEEFIGSSPNGEWLEIIGNIHDNPELLKGGE